MENWCKEHETDWFKTPKMKAYAHPVKDASGATVGWCNKPKDEAAHPSTYEAVEPALVIEAKKLGAVAITSTKDASIARAVAFKGAIDLASNGKIEVKDIGVYSKRYSPWLETGE